MGKEKKKRLLEGHDSQCNEHAKEIVCEENNSCYTARNKHKSLVRKYKIDGDVFQKNAGELRCSRSTSAPVPGCARTPGTRCTSRRRCRA